jgi:Na+/proline symporter
MMSTKFVHRTAFKYHLLTSAFQQRYINPHATEEQILRVSHYMVAAFAIFMGVAGTIFYYIGVSMGWLYVSNYHSPFIFSILTL